MKSYKKRAKSGWAGKTEMKTTGIRKERQFERQEVKSLLDEHRQGEDFRYKHVGKRNKNEKIRMEHRIYWYERIIEKYKRMREERKAQGFSTSLSYWGDGYWESSLNKLKKKYEEKYGIENDCK